LQVKREVAGQPTSSEPSTQSSNPSHFELAEIVSPLVHANGVVASLGQALEQSVNAKLEFTPPQSAAVKSLQLAARAQFASHISLASLGSVHGKTPCDSNPQERISDTN